VKDSVIRTDERTRVPDTRAVPSYIERRVEKEDRRKTSLRSFLQGGLRPRRRGERRASDSHLPIDWHDPYLLLLALLILLLSITDAFLTVTLLTDGAEEANVLLAYVLHEHPRLFAPIKMMLTGFGVVVLVVLARSRLFGIISGRLLFQVLALAYLVLVAYELWLMSLMS